jgi:hypothetical protein
LAIGLIPYPYVVRYIVYVYHTIGWNGVRWGFCQDEHAMDEKWKR